MNKHQPLSKEEAFPAPRAHRALSALDRGGRKCRYVVQIEGHRTSINLEEVYWSALKRISQDEGLSRSELVALIQKNKHPASSLTGAVRLYVLNYIGQSAIILS